MDDLLRKKSVLKLKIVANQTHWRTLKNSSSFTVCLPFFASDTTQKHWTKGREALREGRSSLTESEGLKPQKNTNQRDNKLLREGRSSLTESEGLSASRFEYKLSACCHAPLASHHIPSNRAAHVVKDHHVIELCLIQVNKKCTELAIARPFSILLYVQSRHHNQLNSSRTTKHLYWLILPHDNTREILTAHSTFFCITSQHKNSHLSLSILHPIANVKLTRNTV